MLRTSSGLTADLIAGGGVRVCDAEQHCHLVEDRQTAYQAVSRAEAQGISLDAALAAQPRH
ncbi:MAG: hypothetical protein VKK03_03420 [Synechococcus sp.]|nr:hypothetical protein [Synechococcus sp.]